MKNNLVVVNSSDYRFVDFFNDINTKIDIGQISNDWYVKLKKIVNEIEKNNLSEQVTLSDDRLIMICFKALSVINIKPTLREWWIARRYFELYKKEQEGIEEGVEDFINLYIQRAFSDTDTEELTEEYNNLKASLKEDIIAGQLQVSIPIFLAETLMSEDSQTIQEDSDDEFYEEAPKKKGKKKVIETKVDDSEFYNDNASGDDEQTNEQKIEELLNVRETIINFVLPDTDEGSEQREEAENMIVGIDFGLEGLGFDINTL